MKVINCNWSEFYGNVGDKRIYCFGAGVVSSVFLDLLESKGLLDRIECFVDNAVSKVGTKKVYKDKVFDIISVEQLLQKIRNNAILVTCSDTEAVIRQLEEYELENVFVFSMYLMLSKQFKFSKYTDSLRIGEKMLIPKKIHYCWFGNNEMPQKNRMCIQSWKKYCKDYEIIEWNESNYDYKKNKYMYDAYKNKKWGFVPDYARLDIIYHHGGIYLDVDVEIIRNIDDLLYQHAFCGFDSQIHVNFGNGFGAEPRNEFIKELRDYYETVRFVYNGICDLTTCTTHQHHVFERYGIELEDKKQNVRGMTIYPAIVMSGVEMNALWERREACTCFCHHSDGSWFTAQLSDARRRRIEYIRKFL